MGDHPIAPGSSRSVKPGEWGSITNWAPLSERVTFFVGEILCTITYRGTKIHFSPEDIPRPARSFSRDGITVRPQRERIPKPLNK